MTKFKGSMLAKQMESDGSNSYWSTVSNNNSQRFGSQERQEEDQVFQSNRAINTPSSSPLPTQQAPSSPGSSNHEGTGKSLESEKVVVMDLTSNGKSQNTIQSGGTSWNTNQSRSVKIQLSSSPSDHSSIIHNHQVDHHHHSLHPHIQFNGNHHHPNHHHSNHHHSNHDLLSIDHDRGLSASPSNMSTTSSQGSSSYNNRGMSGGSPMSQRSRKRNPNPIPDSCKDEAYWERRKRNNESAKRSRELRRIKETQQSNKVTVLEQDNLRLRTEVEMLREELNKLREILYNNNQNSSGIRNENSSGIRNENISGIRNENISGIRNGNF